MKKLLEQVNQLLPNLSQNLFVLFNHWDKVEGGDDDDDDGNPEELKEQHLEKVRTFLEKGLNAKAVVDRTFFVSGKEAFHVRTDKEEGKQSTAGRSVVHTFSMVMVSPHVTALSQHHCHLYAKRNVIHGLEHTITHLLYILMVQTVVQLLERLHPNTNAELIGSSLTQTCI